jgi:hypothetical protein
MDDYYGFAAFFAQVAKKRGEDGAEWVVWNRGSGDVRVHATESLQVDIAGSGDVRYRGEPKVSKKVAGSGDVAPLR